MWQGIIPATPAQGLRQIGRTPEQFRHLVLTEYASFGKIIPELGIRPQ